MTKTEKYIALRKSGLSYEAIARKCGVSKQAVHSAIKKHKNATINIKPQSVVFPGLRKWMCDNHIFISDLERMTGKCLRQALSSGKISGKGIAAILEVTRLPYELAFGNIEKEA